MNNAVINSLFVLFSGEKDTDRYEPVISSAIAWVKRMLKEDADENDARLDYLCGAVANLKYVQMTCVRKRINYTYAGAEDSSERPSLEYEFARELVNEYFTEAAELMKDESFVFASVY
ncbi:MAG: hypothetical protein ACI4I9_05170 [Porcipelethomonas sp.]